VDYTKRELRERIRARRIGRDTKFDIAPLMESSVFKSAEVIASYRSYATEPETTELNDAILTSGRQLLLPRLLSDGALEFVPWNGEPAKLRLSGKVEEPIGDAYIGPIDLMIIPSLAADRSGNRLGQGGGSYDRVLANNSTWRVTLLFEDELLDHIPVDAHDQRINAVLLPNQLVNI